MQKFTWIIAVIAALLLVKGLFLDGGNAPPANVDPANADLVIVSGSENRELQPLIDAWASDEGKKIAVVYQGSVDIYRNLQQGAAMPYDAIWPANHLWVELGDTQKVVRHEQSIMRSPVVLGLKQSIARQLGWDKRTVRIQDILDAAEQKRFRLAMTSATQSNSGASAYLGFLYAMAGYPDTLTMQNLQDPSVREKVKSLLSTTNRSSGSSGWLKEALVQHPDRFDAMFNYEALVIEANQALVKQGQEPLYAIYPQDGLSVADSPLGFIDKGDKAKEELFLKLQQYLLSSKVQQRIEGMGRRTGLLGMTVANPDKSVWNPAWGIEADKNIASIPVPQQQVIQEALNLYQTDLRKPSLTVWVLDVSGSMSGAGIDSLKQAMTTLLDPAQASEHLLQPGPQDITYIIPFNNQVEAVWKVQGNDPAQLAAALRSVQSLEARGGTDLYAALVTALQQLQPYQADGSLWRYLPAIVAMTDGRSDGTNRFAFQDALQALPFARDVPIHAIAFGDADTQQLQELTGQSVGRLFQVKGDLPAVLRDAKGYN
ncbi:substrate-binding domain-containing protein [Candidatus Thiothrix sp. Deng01]|uniref:Substrate-binding domain-containing protein n=1 Tax=Candidatus Thiothrix phosphatis TaxID=3112415 RepID=A0ABU6CX82_9GAMM|nr:substrate-binding domain-containing protein [Candidatus Thiothrix sp. Deng01]MEB4591430.1 substrate-binding domain-containing protein [Candidatus Thiothrix sp. Deng01]